MEIRKTRVTLDLSARDHALLIGLRERLEAPSKADTLRRALRHMAAEVPAHELEWPIDARARLAE